MISLVNYSMNPNGMGRSGTRPMPGVGGLCRLLVLVSSLMPASAIAATVTSNAICTLAAPCLWSAAATWAGGVPGVNDKVIIAANTAVILNVNSATIADVVI